MLGDQAKQERIRSERERKRELIKSTALKLFERRGYTGTTLEDVAKELGYRKTNIYYYFKNKEDLFVSIVFDRMDHLVNDMDDMDGKPEPALSTLTKIVDYFVDERFGEAGFFQVFHQIQAFFAEISDHGTRGIMFAKLGHIMSGVQSLIARGQAEGDIRSGDPRTLAGVFLGLVFGVVHLTGGPVIPVANREEYQHMIRTMIARSLAP